MAKLKAPEGVTSCSFGGDQFEVNDKGVAEVPDEAVIALLELGFTVPPLRARAAAATEQAAAQ